MKVTADLLQACDLKQQTSDERLAVLETTLQQQKEVTKEHEAACQRLDSVAESLTQQRDQLAEELRIEQAKHEQFQQDFAIADAALTTHFQDIEARAEELQPQIDKMSTELEQAQQKAEQDLLLMQQKHTQERGILMNDHEALRKAVIDEHAATRNALEDEQQATTRALAADHAALRKTLECEVGRLEEINAENINKVDYLEATERSVAARIQILAEENKVLVDQAEALPTVCDPPCQIGRRARKFEGRL